MGSDGRGLLEKVRPLALTASRRAADREWVEQVLSRDTHTCRISGHQGRCLAAYHLNSLTKYPHLKYELDNRITITEELHREFHARPCCRRIATAQAFAQFYQEETGRSLGLTDYIFHP